MNIIWLFLNFLRNAAILDTASVAGKWVNMDLIENPFLLKYNNREYF